MKSLADLLCLKNVLSFWLDINNNNFFFNLGPGMKQSSSRLVVPQHKEDRKGYCDNFL